MRPTTVLKLAVLALFVAFMFCLVPKAKAGIEQEIIIFFGDANYSGHTNLNDVAVIMNYLFVGGPPPYCMNGADVDGNGNVNVNDAIMLANFLNSCNLCPIPPPVLCNVQ